jgi:hypothetical protein
VSSSCDEGCGGDCSGGAEDVEDDPGSDRMDTIAVLAEGTIQAKPARISAVFGDLLYT